MTYPQLDRAAMGIPVECLVDELDARIRRKQAVLEQRQQRYGPNRVVIGSYMENLGWPELFQYDMNRYFADPEFLLETELRQRLFWADNADDDWLPSLGIGATVGMYYDITMFGQRVWHEPGGVPQFAPHPISRTPDLALLAPLDFHTSGVMPELLAQHRALQRLNAERYGGRLQIGFPLFGRGPLDVAIQLRTYERFVEDTSERPAFVHALLHRIVHERAAWNRARRQYLNEPEPAEPTTRVDDDWLNIPFISPAIFREFVLPAYREIVRLEGTVTGFHTCGCLEPVVEDLLRVFTGITWLDVSGWNDIEHLDRLVEPRIAFSLAVKNTLVLAGTAAQHRELLQRMARLRRRRGIAVCAQAIVKLQPTYEENLARLNAFIRLARSVFAGET